ncbi:MAG: glutamate racemase [Sphingopyxis sp.]
MTGLFDPFSSAPAAPPAPCTVDGARVDDGGVAANAPILFFDSGLGGLSVLRPALALLPHAPIIYATDHAGLPYGEKSEAEIGTRVSALLGRLVERVRPRLAVIACNTASTIALAHVRSALDVPFVGTVPAIKPAAINSRSRVIGVLGTAATVRQPYVDRLTAEFGADCTVLRFGAPDLVLAAERALRGDVVDPAIFAAAIAGLRAQPGGERMDHIVLACTHFPLLAEELQAVAGPDVRLIDGSAGIARRIAHLTAGQAWPDGPPTRHVIANGGRGDITAAWPNFAALGFSGASLL